jgi:hypothetical protein
MRIGIINFFQSKNYDFQTIADGENTVGLFKDVRQHDPFGRKSLKNIPSM